MARTSYGRVRGVGARTHHLSKAWKAMFWGLIFFGLASYTIITSSRSFLQWLEKRSREDEEDSQGLNVNMTWTEVQERRVGRLRRGCEALGLRQTLGRVVLKHLLVDFSHHALFCYVPKVASTSWKRQWLLLVGAAQEDEVLSLPRAYVHYGPSLPNLASDKFTDETREEMLGSYKKFLFTRNPLERVVSAYRDKLEGEDLESSYDFHKHVGREVEQAVRGRVTGKGHNVTFPEFVEWLVSPLNGTSWSEGQKNEHWRPLVDLCAPCLVEYDAIGMYENLENDAKEALQWIGAGNLAHAFPPPSKNPHATPAVAEDYLQRLPASQRLGFYRAYLLDYLLFGYHIL